MENNQSIGYEICKIARKIHQYLKKELKNYNISPEQWVILKTLFEADGISQKEISDKVDKDTNNIKVLIDKLEKKGFVIRKRNQKDKRSFSVYITQDGKELAENLCLLDRNMLDEIVSNLSSEDFFNIDIILKKIENNISNK